MVNSNKKGSSPVISIIDRNILYSDGKIFGMILHAKLCWKEVVKGMVLIHNVE